MITNNKTKDNIESDQILEESEKLNEQEVNYSDDTNKTNIIDTDSKCSIEIKEETHEKELSNSEAEIAKNLYNDVVTFLGKTLSVEPEDENKVRNVIPTGIDVLDAVLGGGVGTKLVQIVGQPGCGKSALAARILASGQRRWPGKFIGLYIDSEQSMSKERLAQLGVKYPEITPYTDDITVEKVFKIVEQLCLYKEEHPELMNIPSCIVWDSVANTLTERGMDGDKYTEVIGQKANVLSYMLPKYTSKLNKYCISLLCVNQLRERVEMNAMYSSPATLKFLADKNIPGGNSLLYNSFQLFYFRQKEEIKGEFGFKGAITGGKTVKNKLFTPNIDIEMVFSFERGFSNFWTNYILLKKFKRVSIGGGWVTIEGYSGSRCQQKGLLQKYREDENFRKVWNENVIDVLNTEIYQKYSMDSSNTVDI